MIGFPGNRRILLASQPVDFRKGMDSLAALVSEVLKASPFCGDVFVFRSKRCDRLKFLVWDGSGLILATKRLEEGRFCWPPVRDGTIQLSAAQMSMLLEGLTLTWTKTDAKLVRRPQRAA
jgi:transposase